MFKTKDGHIHTLLTLPIDATKNTLAEIVTAVADKTINVWFLSGTLGEADGSLKLQDDNGAPKVWTGTITFSENQGFAWSRRTDGTEEPLFVTTVSKALDIQMSTNASFHGTIQYSLTTPGA